MLLSAYVRSTVLKTTFLVFCLIAGLVLFITFIGELRHLGRGDFGVKEILIFSSLEVFTEVYKLFPIVGLLGGLIGLGILASSQELTVMRASGMSASRIFAAVIQAALILIASALVIGELIGPQARELADKHKAAALSGGNVVDTLHGIWFRDGNSFIHVEAVYSEEKSEPKLQGVTIYEFDEDHQLKVATKAENAQYYAGQWFLENLASSQISKTEVIVEEQDRRRWDTKLDTGIFNLFDSYSERMSLLRLYEYINYLKINGVNASSFELDFYQRILRPIAAMIMLLLAIPFVFGSLRSVSMGRRIFVGTLFGLSFYLFNQFFGLLGIINEWPVILVAVLPILLFSILGIFTLRRSG